MIKQMTTDSDSLSSNKKCKEISVFYLLFINKDCWKRKPIQSSTFTTLTTAEMFLHMKIRNLNKRYFGPHIQS